MERSNIDIPESFQIDNGPEGFVIRLKLLEPEIIVDIFYCLVFNGFLIVFIFLDSVFSFSTVLYLIFVLWMDHRVFAYLFNTTTITIGCDEIKVRHAPVPAFGEKTIARAGIQQVYSKKTIISPGWYALQYHPYWLNSYPYKTCGVNVIVNGGGDIKLIGGFCRKEDALFIEQQIEKYLGISNAPVPGELPR